MAQKWHDIRVKKPILRHEREVDRVTGEVYEWQQSDPILVVSETWREPRICIAYAERENDASKLRFLEDATGATLDVIYWMPLPAMPEIYAKGGDNDG